MNRRNFFRLIIGTITVPLGICSNQTLAMQRFPVETYDGFISKGYKSSTVIHLTTTKWGFEPLPGERHPQENE